MRKMEKKGRGKTGEKAGEILDVWTKFFMSATMKIRYNFERKWGKRQDKLFSIPEDGERA
ncbi:hypothetical protein ACF5W4_01050 [Bacillota bacterium Lsc_1132]